MLLSFYHGDTSVTCSWGSRHLVPPDPSSGPQHDTRPRHHHHYRLQRVTTTTTTTTHHDKG